MTKEDARKSIDDILACFGNKPGDGTYELTRLDAKDMREAIRALSTEKVGKWELVYRDGGVEHYLCNKCCKGRAMIDGDFYRDLMDFKHCPECGARMMGDI